MVQFTSISPSSMSSTQLFSTFSSSITSSNASLPLLPNLQSHLYPYFLFNIQLATPMSQSLFTRKLVTLHFSTFFSHSSAFFSCYFKPSVSFACPTLLSSCSQLTSLNSIKIFYFSACSIIPKLDILCIISFYSTTSIKTKLDVISHTLNLSKLIIPHHLFLSL